MDRKDLSSVFNPNKYGWINGPYAVGWLGRGAEDFPTGKSSADFIDRLKVYCSKPIFVARCYEDCPWSHLHECGDGRAISAEICLKGADGRWFSAPTLIAHYVEQHHYAPPAVFVDSVMNPQEIHRGRTDWVQVTQSDLQMIESWIGRKPSDIHGVAVRKETGQPIVVANHPIRKIGARYEPFPTLYWLVEPKLAAEISNIERLGGVGEIDSMLRADETRMRSHLRDNKQYAQARWGMINAKEVRVAKEIGFMDVLENTGIGGVANHASVKCLHAQYAYHLAKYDTGTTVGRLMEERYGIRFTP